MRRLVVIYGLSGSRVGQLTQELLDMGKITPEEIKEGKERAKQKRRENKMHEMDELKREKEEAASRMKEKIAARSEIKPIKENLTEDEITKIIIEGVHNLERYDEIARKIGRTKSAVGQRIQTLVKRGKLQQEEVDRVSNLKKRKENDIVSVSRKLQILNKVYELLIAGLGKRQIRNILKISEVEYEVVKQELLDHGLLTKEEIEGYREARRIKCKDITYEGLINGKNNVEIASSIPYGDRNYVIKFTDELIKEGRITNEEIEAAKADREEAIEGFVLEKTKEGFTAEEIEDMAEARRLGVTVNMVQYRRQKFLKQGKISKNDTDNIRIKKRKEKSEEDRKSGPYDERIIKLTELGFKKEEIAIVIGTGEQYVSERRKAFKEQGRGIDVVKTRELVKNREKRASKRRNSIDAMINFARIVNADTVKDHIEYIRAKKDLGELETSEMNRMRRIVPMDHDLLTLRNINFVVDYLRGEDKIKQAIDFINECLDSANDYREKKWQEVMRLKNVLEQELEKRKAEEEANKNKRARRGEAWKART